MQGFTIGSNKLVNKDLRRISHLTSEQKRRFSIKVEALMSAYDAYGNNSPISWILQCGLDTLNELVPGLEASNGSRISKATTLHKGNLTCFLRKENLFINVDVGHYSAAEYCRKLKASKQELQEEIDKVRNEIYINEQAIKSVHIIR